MLNVKSLDEALTLLRESFKLKTQRQTVPVSECVGRTVFDDIKSSEFVPDFDRSTVDGYAVFAADTFGCTEALPAVLKLAGEVEMGKPAPMTLTRGEAAYVPTGGQLPRGADAMVMLEYTEDFGGGELAVTKPSAPGAHMIFRGDDVKPEKVVFPRGHRLLPKDVGALAAMGVRELAVFKKPRVWVISTGDELVSAETQSLAMGQMRDVNSPMLSCAIATCGGECAGQSLVADDPAALKAEIEKCLALSDMVLVSGGSSVGVKDASAQILSEMGELLFHGLALKPGKPTMAALVGQKLVFGLPGHPVAAYYVFNLLVRPLIYAMLDSTVRSFEKTAVLTAACPSNHGREECVPVSLCGNEATPIRSKSGLITTLSGADGFIRIARDAEGVDKGQSVQVCLFSEVL